MGGVGDLYGLTAIRARKGATFIQAGQRAVAFGIEPSFAGAWHHAVVHEQEPESLLYVEIRSSEGRVERSLVYRAGMDSLAAGFPLGHHPVADPKVDGELPQAHPTRLAQSPYFPAGPPTHYRSSRAHAHTSSPPSA